MKLPLNSKNILLFILILLIFLTCDRNISTSETYTSSIHGDTTYGVMRDDIYNLYNAISRGNCLHCHEMHTSVGGNEPAPQGGAQPYALFAFEEDVCFYCHRTNSHNIPALNKDIQDQFSQPYHHPVEWSGKHSLAHLETSSDLQPPNRHAECADCHNPHTVKQDVHTAGSPPSGNSTADNNRVSGALTGVFGVEPSWGTNWGPSPTSFTEMRPTVTNPAGGAEREYQICLKCHSYYGFGNNLDTNTGLVTITWTTNSTYLTDQAREFSPNNYSVHPVVEPLETRAGGYAPKSLGNNRMKPPWDTYAGQQTMYCSDCHGEDASPKGPHGTTTKHILTSGYYWPKKPDSCGGGYWTLGDVKNNNCEWGTQLLCAKCHKICSDGVTCSGRNFYNKVHSIGDHFSNYTINGTIYNGPPCISCHMAIPHGSHASRLIVYTSDIHPYNLGEVMAQVSGFKKASDPNSYDLCYCYSTTSACSYHSESENEWKNSCIDSGGNFIIDYDP